MTPLAIALEARTSRTASLPDFRTGVCGVVGGVSIRSTHSDSKQEQHNGRSVTATTCSIESRHANCPSRSRRAFLLADPAARTTGPHPLRLNYFNSPVWIKVDRRVSNRTLVDADRARISDIPNARIMIDNGQSHA